MQSLLSTCWSTTFQHFCIPVCLRLGNLSIKIWSSGMLKSVRRSYQQLFQARKLDTFMLRHASGDSYMQQNEACPTNGSVSANVHWSKSTGAAASSEHFCGLFLNMTIIVCLGRDGNRIFCISDHRYAPADASAQSWKTVSAFVFTFGRACKVKKTGRKKSAST